MPYEIPDFTKGKAHSRRPGFVPPEPFHITVIPRDEAREFFNAGTDDELRNHLRGLRDLGLLVHSEGRLTQRVRTDAGRVAAYVVRGKASEVPRRRRRGSRVLTV